MDSSSSSTPPPKASQRKQRHLTKDLATSSSLDNPLQSNSDIVSLAKTINNTTTDVPCDKTARSQLSAEAELSCLLELREQEIRALKFELEKYKLALHQSQLDYHYIQRQLISQQRNNQQDSATSSANDNEATIDDNIDNILAEAARTRERESLSEIGTLIADDDEDVVASIPRRRLASLGQDPAEKQAAIRFHQERSTIANKKIAPQFDQSSDAPASDNSSRVIFKAGGEDEDEHEDDGQADKHSSFVQPDSSLADDVDIDDIIPDVGEIDLNLELEDIVDSNNHKKKTTSSVNKNSVHGESNRSNNGDDQQTIKDEDIISDGLLTSLTDAAISNLSQLAALQERCESQQHSQQQFPQQKQSTTTDQQRQTPQQQQQAVSLKSTGSAQSADASSAAPLLGPIGTVSQPYTGLSSCDQFPIHDPFSSSALNANRITGMSTIVSSSTPTSSTMIAPVSSSNSSISPPDSIQADLSTSHSLASVVAAAAVAAAAANDQHHLNHLPHHQAQLQHQDVSVQHPTARLISSALPSPEFYHNLQHHHQHAQNHLQMLTGRQQHSPVSSIHFSPSTSITPHSSSSLLAHSRRPASNASSSLLSPITSPNYLRRQFMPDRMSIMSPSPTSGIATGSSSAASSSLAHIIQQQRSASALGGATISASSTPLSSAGSTAVSPMMSNKNSSLARLNNMQIRNKFGYLGSGRAQFNSPHGFCLGLNQEIVVADTNNHRVCIFDKSGTYLTQFGLPGKEDGQLWNPRKVAILHRPSNPNSETSATGHHQLLHHDQYQRSQPVYSNNSGLGGGTGGSEPLYVVCDRGAERSRMQLFTKDGVFIKKIGIHYIDIVAGLAITQNGLIIVVDSVSPTVYIINGETGILNGWFDCSGHMKEPSDIAVKSDVPGNEYFICDFKGHCVVVFSEQGEYLRKIGHDGLTSYPNGIDISDDGDILVGDSHGNRFHVVVFDRNGKFVSQFECPHVKVSRCCGLKITREGYIATLAKNNHFVLVLDTIHI